MLLITPHKNIIHINRLNIVILVEQTNVVQIQAPTSWSSVQKEFSFLCLGDEQIVTDK